MYSSFSSTLPQAEFLRHLVCKITLRMITIAISFFSFSTSSLADSVSLKNGKIYQGEILSETESMGIVRINVDGKIHEIPKVEIETMRIVENTTKVCFVLNEERLCKRLIRITKSRAYFANDDSKNPRPIAVDLEEIKNLEMPKVDGRLPPIAMGTSLSVRMENGAVIKGKVSNTANDEIHLTDETGKARIIDARDIKQLMVMPQKRATEGEAETTGETTRLWYGLILPGSAQLLNNRPIAGLTGISGLLLFSGAGVSSYSQGQSLKKDGGFNLNGAFLMTALHESQRETLLYLRLFSNSHSISLFPHGNSIQLFQSKSNDFNKMKAMNRAALGGLALIYLWNAFDLTYHHGLLNFQVSTRINEREERQFESKVSILF